jgi:hypothetical protein
MDKILTNWLYLCKLMLNFFFYSTSTLTQPKQFYTICHRVSRAQKNTSFPPSQISETTKQKKLKVITFILISIKSFLMRLHGATSQEPWELEMSPMYLSINQSICKYTCIFANNYLSLESLTMLYQLQDYVIRGEMKKWLFTIKWKGLGRKRWLLVPSGCPPLEICNVQ